MNHITKFLTSLLFVVIFAATTTIAQEDPPKSHSNHDHKMNMKNDTQKHMDIKNHKMNQESMMDSCKMMKNQGSMMDSCKMMKNQGSMTNTDHKEMMKDSKSIIRDGIIDLNAIDENADGKVYQDVMDWNVISDEPGECPKCGMKLREVSLSKAKANLKKNGFIVK